MDARTRLILSFVMTAVMVFMVTLIATSLNVGFGPGFLQQWAKAYIVAWPVAALTAFVVMPGARRIADRIVALLDSGFRLRRP